MATKKQQNSNQNNNYGKQKRKNTASNKAKHAEDSIIDDRAKKDI